jgi:hypothetical protein
MTTKRPMRVKDLNKDCVGLWIQLPGSKTLRLRAVRHGTVAGVGVSYLTDDNGRVHTYSPSAACSVVRYAWTS